jgi:hypothetical protein
MKMLKLELDALRVESFHAASAGRGRGTVRGNAAGIANDKLGCSSVNTLVTDESYQQTCIFYTCGGCTSDDPAYC